MNSGSTEGRRTTSPIIDGTWTAWRRDGQGGRIADPSPEGLLRLIRADYAAMPVPRDLPGGSAG